MDLTEDGDVIIRPKQRNPGRKLIASDDGDDDVHIPTSSLVPASTAAVSAASTATALTDVVSASSSNAGKVRFSESRSCTWPNRS